MNNLKKLRLQHKLTLRELAEKVNMHYTTLSSIESNKTHFNNDYIKALTTFFNVSSDYLLGLSDSPLLMPDNVIVIPVYNTQKEIIDHIPVKKYSNKNIIAFRHEEKTEIKGELGLLNTYTITSIAEEIEPNELILFTPILNDIVNNTFRILTFAFNSDGLTFLSATEKKHYTVKKEEIKKHKYYKVIATYYDRHEETYTYITSNKNKIKVKI